MNARIPFLIACGLACAVSGFARADAISDLKSSMESLQRQLDSVKAQLEAVTGQVQKQKQEQEKQPMSGPFVQMKPGDALTFLAPGGGEVTLYGNLDVSLDTTTKGFKSDYGDNGGVPVGKVGWQPAIATNLSYLGVRGTHPLMSDVNFVWQLEAGIDISATPGTKETTSNTSDTVNVALFSRNSFIGLAGKDWGAVMIGKSETPYKTSTDRLNPFSGMLGDYRVIMGNTGGDNRVEFGYRAPHAIWYNSPNWSGFSFSAMYGPGQNRSNSGDPLGANSNLASAEQDCAGGNIPGSRALPPACTDGSFGTLYSVTAEFTWESLYLLAAYEQHNAVNRSSDTIGFPTTPPADTQGDPNDVANETAWKVGGQ